MITALSVSVTRMISSLNLPTLEQRRNKAKLIAMYKILNGNLEVPTDDFLPNQRLSRESYVNQLQTVIDSYKFSFFPSVIRLWNALPPFVINFLTLDDFCTNLPNHYDHTCAQLSF